MRCALLALTVSTLSSLALTPVLSAQEIRGQVVDSTTGTPVGTGFVVLLNAEGNEIARSLSGVDGRFVFHILASARGGRPFKLRSERIGYRAVVSEPFDLTAGDQELTLRIHALPVALSTIEVRDETECRTRPSEDERTAVVWEEARKALAAASWTASQQSYRFLSNMYERTLDRGRRAKSDEWFRPKAGRYAMPFVSRDPELLDREGYIIEDGTFEYFAPDAQVLQHESFLTTHCFRIVRENAPGVGFIGLAFEPVPSRRLPDVEGVLWLDEASAELRTLEYRYTNHPYDLRDVLGGGTVDFMPVPSGAWIVHRWEIRAPFIEVITTNRIPREAPRIETVVTGFRDVGGEVLTITTNGSRVYQAAMAEVSGIVWDSLQGEPTPLAGAEVRVANSWFMDSTDANGRFHIWVPLDGEYDVTFTHSKAESLGFSAAPHSVTLARGRMDTLSLSIPPMERIVANHCSGFLGPDHRVLLGTVRDSATGLPLSGARVRVQWQSLSGSQRLEIERIRNHTEERTTGTNGEYRVCGLELDRPATVTVSRDGLANVPLRIVFEAGGVMVGTEFRPTTSPIWKQDLFWMR